MKKILHAAALSAAIVSGSAFAAPAGTEITGSGKVVDEAKVVMFQVPLSKGERVERHDYHDKRATLFLTVSKGKVDVLLNDSELHHIEAGKILRYSGKDFVQSTATEDALIFVTIIPSE